MADTNAANEIKALIAKKDQIEAEIKRLMSILDEQGHVGMDGPLVDREQFPRSDIDVYTVRQARHKISCLQNDHKNVMKEIEAGLYQVHAAAREQKASSTRTEEPMVTDDAGYNSSTRPFIKVNRVDHGSPAAESGLEVDDLIVRFGSINASNFTDLKGIAALAENSKGNSVHLAVLRGKQQVQLALTPKPWSGKGLLGCNVVPYKP